MTVHVRPITSADETAIRALLRRLSVFESHEVQVAEELLAESLAGSRDYVIHVAEQRDDEARDGGGCVVGYVCHGHNPVTDAIYDVYWIGVDPDVQGRGVGRALLEHAEACIKASRGRGIVIETSSRDEYIPARRLYERCGYRCVADVPDYYKPGDGLQMYMKLL